MEKLATHERGEALSVGVGVSLSFEIFGVNIWSNLILWRRNGEIEFQNTQPRIYVRFASYWAPNPASKIILSKKLGSGTNIFSEEHSSQII